MRSSLMLILFFLTVAGCQPTATAPDDPAAKRQIGTVVLSVDFGGRSDNVNVEIPCSADSTVFDILNRAMLNGDLKINATGSGETAFVHSINGVGEDAEDRSAGNFWVYKINDQIGKTGSGVTEVDPADVVSWRFGRAPADLFD